MNDIEAYKDIIPQFVVKLYHILEKPEYKEFITWANEGTQIFIKHPKKLEDKVLPYFFRHRHLTSFIRQLNMYKFNKVNKISKERAHMYFKNDHFRRGELYFLDLYREEMKLIRRNHKNKNHSLRDVSIEAESHHKDLSEESEGSALRAESQKKFEEIEKILNRTLQKFPNLKSDLTPALSICKNMKYDRPYLIGLAENSMTNLMFGIENEENENKNMLGTTVRDFLPPMGSFIMPSICSLTHLDC